MDTKESPSAESGARTIDGYRESRERIAVKRNALRLVNLAWCRIPAVFHMCEKKMRTRSERHRALIFVSEEFRTPDVSIHHTTQASDYRPVVVTFR